MPGGLFVVEAVLVPGLVSSGMTLASAISAMLIYRLISWIFIAAIGWVVFFFMFRTEADIIPTPHPTKRRRANPNNHSDSRRGHRAAACSGSTSRRPPIRRPPRLRLLRRPDRFWAEPSVATPGVASVIAAPIPVPATDGKTHLAYELQLTNALAQEVTLTSVDVLAGGRSLLNLSGDRLAYWTRIIGTPTPTTKIGPAQSAIVWLDVVLDENAAVPSQLVHAVGISLPEPMPPLFEATMTENVAPVTVQTRKPVVITPPLTGPKWLDVNGCCNMGPHRMTLKPINGQLWAAERFAIDYVQLGPDGRLFTGDRAKVGSYPSSVPTSMPSRTVRSSRLSTDFPSNPPVPTRRTRARPVCGQPHRAGPR